jgi:hypothetical protein
VAAESSFAFVAPAKEASGSWRGQAAGALGCWAVEEDDEVAEDDEEAEGLSADDGEDEGGAVTAGGGGGWRRDGSSAWGNDAAEGGWGQVRRVGEGWVGARTQANVCRPAVLLFQGSL